MRARWSISAGSASPIELRSEGLPPDVERASAYCTRFCGHEFGRLPRPYSDWPTPEIPNNVSQIVLERVLRRCAESQPGAQVHFGRRLTSFAAHDDHVVAEIEDTQSGERSRIRARYLLGIDGAGSMVRRSLGIGMTGEDGTTHRAFMGGTMMSFYIRSPTLMAASGRAPTNMTWIINPDMRGMMYSQDGRETWVVHYQVPAGIDWQKVDGRAVIAAHDRCRHSVRDHLRRSVDRRARARCRALSRRARCSSPATPRICSRRSAVSA